MSLLIRLSFILILSLTAHAKVVEDLNHQQITVPDKIDKVFGSSPPMNYLIYALNPNKMIGLNFNAKNPNNYAGSEFLNSYFLSLPIIGSFHGGGQSINLETILKYKPDLILVWEDDMLVEKVKSEIQKTKIPTLTIPFRKIEDMPRAIKLTGDIIDEEKRGDILSAYAQKIIDEINTALKNVKPIRYYYAEGTDGLATECASSFHVEALNFSGGENVHKCQQSGVLGLEKINFEALIAYDPDVIIIQNALVFNDIVENPLWQHLRAVKNKNIHLVPSNPFNWIDRPPSFMRIIGTQWLTKLFHPKEYGIDLHQRVSEFYELFLGVKPIDEEIKKLLGEKQ